MKSSRVPEIKCIHSSNCLFQIGGSWARNLNSCSSNTVKSLPDLISAHLSTTHGTSCVYNVCFLTIPWYNKQINKWSYLVFGDTQLKLSILFLDVVVLNLHLVRELEPLLEGFGHRALQLHLLLRSLQSLPHLHGRSAMRQGPGSS